MRRADPHAGDPGDERTADERVPRRLAQRLLADRACEVVRNEERRERHDDEEVEEQHPAGDEPGEVVERAPHEGRRAAGLGNRGRALRVRERHEDEHGAREEQDERREPERRRGDDAERDVERRRDLAVRDGEERRRVEDALEPAELARHYECLLRSSREARDAEHDEETAEHVADDAAALQRRPDEQGDADRDEERREHQHRDRVPLHVGPAAATSTRQLACLRT